MIIIVDGIDRVGKTTLCKKLEACGFEYFKDEFLIDPFNTAVDKRNYSYGKLDTTLKMLKEKKAKGINIVVDRLVFTEMVYGTIDRGINFKKEYVDNYIHELIKLGSQFIFMDSLDINKSCFEAGKNLKRHAALFTLLNRSYLENFLDDITYYKCSWKVLAYDLIDLFVYNLLHSGARYTLYFASPFFTPEQIEREERLKKHLRANKLNIYSPKESCHLNSSASFKEQQLVFDENCKAIKDSAAVFAITDGKDMGTVWEAGYAYGINKPVIYFAESLGKQQFNLMLAQSGRRAFTQMSDITFSSVFDAITGVKTRYEGAIE